MRPLLSPAIPIPESLIQNLLTRFSTAEGYKLFEDVLPFFHKIRELRQSASNSSRLFSTLEVGIITNSDDRVPSVLSDLGLHVGHRRYGTSTTALDLEDPSHVDIDFVVMSYDVGFEKPDRRIFDTARELGSKGKTFEPYECLHIGDHFQQDFLGAQAAGWNSLLLSRDQLAEENHRVKDFLSLVQILEHLC